MTEIIKRAESCVGHLTTVRIYKLDEPSSFVSTVSGILKQLSDGRFWVVGENFTCHFAPESISDVAIEVSKDKTYRGIYISKTTPQLS